MLVPVIVHKVKNKRSRHSLYVEEDSAFGIHFKVPNLRKGGKEMTENKTLTLEQKRELLQDIFGSNEELIDLVTWFLKEEEDRRENEVT